MENKTYIAIDLKSFYASVECINRNLDPLKTNLVVADDSRTQKTICLAVSPALKSFGIPGRPRLFEVISAVQNLNLQKLKRHRLQEFTTKSFDIDEINSNNEIGIEFIVAPPRMKNYIEISTEIYKIYLNWVAPEDIYVYSIDEVFIDATDYLKLYKMSGKEFASKMILDVFKNTGVTATGGIGSNLYLCKVAMDILAKHEEANEQGVRIAELDEIKYKKLLWDHKPITDFWRVGKGYEKRLKKHFLYTMGDIAQFSLKHEDILYKEFGINAELLIDHAWGYEPCTLKDVKDYRPSNISRSSGQVLSRPYNYEEARVVIHEMAKNLALDLYSKKYFTNNITISISYDRVNLENDEIMYEGEVAMDSYGRKVPKKSRGTKNLSCYTNSSMLLTKAVLELFDGVVNKELYIRKINISANNLCYEENAEKFKNNYQLDLFNSNFDKDTGLKREEFYLKKEKNIQDAIIQIKEKYGKNAILKGTNFKKGATGIERNNQIGGHRS